MKALVVVSGPVASGKTSLAVPLAERLDLPLLAKDTVKEALFDALGTGGEDWSERLGAAAYAVLWALAARFPAALLEANFGARDVERLRSLCDRPVQVHCTGPPAELERRFAARERHPGHVDDEYPRGRTDQARPLELGGPLLVVDTTADVDVDAVAAWVSEQLSEVA
ncbi:MAG TPA: AAA family ATPase [Acidimicrobiales bacterium]|nr:AAA family ATPase [Acidimicrobiales bacterium]